MNIHRLMKLTFYIPLDTKIGHFRDVPPRQLLSLEKAKPDIHQ